MRWAGLPSRVVGFVLFCGLLWLGVVAWPAAFVDRGATGTVRISVFPLVLTLFDPFVWTCVVNSLIIAALVTAGSLSIGVALGMAGTGLRYRGRSALWMIAILPLAAEPLLLAPAIGLILANPTGWDWLAARALMGYPLDDLVRWSALVWIGLASGSPIVALATSSTLRKLDPTWMDAARLTGAGRWRVWREIVWPILKPSVAAAGSAVFVLSLVEPAGPWILGLDRTLASQILDSAIRLDQPTRPACLALLAMALAGLVRTLIGWWGGPTVPTPDHREPIEEPADLRSATLGRLILVGWAVFAVGPVAFLAYRSFQVLPTLTNGGGSEGLQAWLADPELLGWFANSATTAGFALLIDFIILSSWLGRSSDRGLRLASNFLRGIPPLALGVGAFATPWLLEALADAVGGTAGQWFGTVARELNPARSPGFLLILVVAAGKWPILFRVAELARGRSRKVLVDASKLMGDSDRRSNQGGRGWSGFVPPRVACLIFALGATNLAPALLMTPFSERRTTAPAIIQSVVGEGKIDRRIAAGILVVLVLKIGAFAVASKSKIGTLADWYRG